MIVLRTHWPMRVIIPIVNTIMTREGGIFAQPILKHFKKKKLAINML